MRFFQPCRLAIISIIALAVLHPMPALADTFATQTVPVDVATSTPNCDPAVGTVKGCYGVPNAAPTVTATSVPPPVMPNTAITQGFFAKLETGTLNTIESLFSTAINVSIVIAQRLFLLISLISLLIAGIRAASGAEDLQTFVHNVYWRLFEGTLWFGFISWTWQGPVGTNGWFPLMIGALASYAAQIADATAGTQLVQFTDHIFTFNILPGSIADMGAALMGAIAKLAFTQIAGQPSTLPGFAGNIANGIQATIAVIGSAFTGTLAVNLVIYILTMLTGIWVFVSCLWLSFRYFLITVKIYGIACLSLIMGFFGSRRLSAFGGGFFSAALAIGLEFFLTTIIVGIFYTIVMGLIENMGLWPLVANMLSVAPIIGQPVAIAHAVASLGDLLTLDAVTWFWVMAMHQVPSTVGSAFSGVIDASPRDAVATLKASPTLGGKLLGGAAGAIQDGAEHGPIQASWTTMQQLGRAAAMGATSPMRGSMAGTVDGASRAARGGVAAAAAGAAGAWVAGHWVSNSGKTTGAQQTASSDAPTNSAQTSADTATEGAASGSSSGQSNNASANSNPTISPEEAEYSSASKKSLDDYYKASIAGRKPLWQLQQEAIAAASANSKPSALPNDRFTRTSRLPQLRKY